MSDNNTTCQGCLMDIVNQLGHMEPGGCLYTPSDDDLDIDIEIDFTHEEIPEPPKPTSPLTKDLDILIKDNYLKKENDDKKSSKDA